MDQRKFHLQFKTHFIEQFIMKYQYSITTINYYYLIILFNPINFNFQFINFKFLIKIHFLYFENLINIHFLYFINLYKLIYIIHLFC